MQVEAVIHVRVDRGQVGALLGRVAHAEGAGQGVVQRGEVGGVVVAGVVGAFDHVLAREVLDVVARVDVDAGAGGLWGGG